MANCTYFHRAYTGFLGWNVEDGCIRFGQQHKIDFDTHLNFYHDYCGTSPEAFETCPFSDPQIVVEKTSREGFCEHCPYFEVRNPLASGGICTYADVPKKPHDGCIIGESLTT